MLKQLELNIQTKLNNEAFNDILLRGQIVLLLWRHCKKVLNAETKLLFDPLQLFSRLISIAQPANKFKEYFKYELIQEPTSIFKDGFMRESHKSDLKNTANFESSPASNTVVDGGALHHQVS